MTSRTERTCAVNNVRNNFFGAVPMKFDSRSVLMLLVASAVNAQQQQAPAVRPLPPAVAKSTESFSALLGVRQLPGGRVLVNDPFKRRVLLFDSTLATFTVVADSTSSTANAYGPRPGGLIPYKGDSTLFVDAASMSMLVISPEGTIARVMSVPRSQDAGMLASGTLGSPGFDARGRLVYRGGFRFNFTQPPGGGRPIPPEPPESAAIVRVDLTSRQLDTAGFIKIPKMRMQGSMDANGRMVMTSEVNPLPVVDDWAVLADGSVAFVRGRDYHIDWVNPDGTKSSSPKMPFDWQRLTDEDKVAFIDSVKAARERMRGSGGPFTVMRDSTDVRRANTPGGAPPGGGGSGSRGTPRSSPDSGRAAGAAAVERGSAVTVIRGEMPVGGPGGGVQVNFVAPSELPDYKPPFFAGAVRADTDDNLWIRTIPTKGVTGGVVHDVVNRRGEIVDRVLVPTGRNVVGFGRGGVVYVTVRDGDSIVLERVRVR